MASSHKPKESWCNWEGKPYNWVGPLPSVDMVSSGSVYASPTHIPFRDNENFIAGNVQANCHKWRTILLNYSKADEIFRYVSLGVDIQEFFTPFKGTFQGRSYDSPIPPRIVFPNARNCQDHEGFISNCIFERVRNGSLLVVGKVGFVDPPHLVMPITIEPTKPRMCHDERFLNLWIKDCPFTLDYITDLPRYVGLNHFQSTIDDKSGYDHIPLHPSSCTFFGLQWKGYYFTYTTIPFGWKASAYIYNTVGMAATSYIRSLGVPCSQYIDDRHLGQLRPRSKSHVNFSNFQLAEMGTFIACSVLLELGYFLSVVKSVFIPRIKVKFLGHICQSDIQAFTLPRDKVLKFATLRDSILESKTVSLKKLQKFAGKTTSFSLSVPAAKLFTNCVYQAISAASKTPRAIAVSSTLKQELLHWRFLDDWNGYLPWKDEKHVSITLFCDASDVGWGGVLKVPEKEEKTLRGYWDDDTRQLPIAVREARALLHTLESVGEIIANSRVDCFIDNKVVVSCWERQLSQMPALSSVMKDIFSLTLKFNLALKTFFVPSRENPADFPSRSLSDADCKLSPLAWKLVDQAFGPHSLDLMALSSNVQCDSKGKPLRFFSPFPNPGSSGTNLFAQVLDPSENAYVFPPFVLVGPLLNFLSSQPCPITLVVPDLSPKRYWWPILYHRASSYFQLGSKGQKDILLFPNSNLSGSFAPRALQWDLWVFRVLPSD